MPASQFDKDFGYLMPFLDKVAAAAAGISDPATCAELTRLIADEKQRWTRIGQLLSGAASKSQSPGAAASATVDAAAAALQATRPTFTVGSLRPKRD